MPYQINAVTVAPPEFALSSKEHEIVGAVVTKFAADLVLHRLTHPASAGAAALEEVATAAAVMIAEKREPVLIEALAVDAIIESVSSGATDEFFEELASGSQLGMSAGRLKQAVRVIHGKLAGGGLPMAA